MVKPVRVGDLTEEEELALIQKEAAKNIDSRKSRFEQFYKKMTTKKHTFHFAKETPVFLIVFCVALNVFLICLACIFFHTGIESHETQLDVTEVTGEDCFSEGEEYDMSEITNTPVEVTESVSVVEAEQEAVRTDSAPVESDPMTSMPESEC